MKALGKRVEIEGDGEKLFVWLSFCELIHPSKEKVKWKTRFRLINSPRNLSFLDCNDDDNDASLIYYSTHIQ